MLYLQHSKLCSIFVVQNNYVLLLIQAGGIELMDVHMSRIMGKPTICICQNSAFVLATPIVQFLLYLTPKFQASSLLLWLYRPVCVGPVQKPHCWFFHKAAHIFYMQHQHATRLQPQIVSICICKTKMQISCAVTALLISTFFFFLLHK